MVPWVSEWSVRDFVAEQLEPTGDVVRELPIPGASAAPFRTDEIDEVIDPQIIAEENKGFVDIAYQPYANAAPSRSDAMPDPSPQLPHPQAEERRQCGEAAAAVPHTTRSSWRPADAHLYPA
jgi:hypothetical protein